MNNLKFVEAALQNDEKFSILKYVGGVGCTITYSKSDYEETNEYDERGNLIRFRNSLGYTEENTYNENDVLISSVNSEGMEYSVQNDGNTSSIHYKDDHKEYWKTIENAKNRPLYSRNKNNREYWATYYRNGKSIRYFTDNEGFESVTLYTKDMRVIFCIPSEGKIVDHRKRNLIGRLERMPSIMYKVNFISPNSCKEIFMDEYNKKEFIRNGDM